MTRYQEPVSDLVYGELPIVRYISRKYIVATTGLAPMQVSNSLQLLKRKGLVESQRGNGPGSQVWRRVVPAKCPECGKVRE